MGERGGRRRGVSPKAKGKRESTITFRADILLSLALLWLGIKWLRKSLVVICDACHAYCRYDDCYHACNVCCMGGRDERRPACW